MIDNQLNFKSNSEYVCKTLGKKVGVLSRSRVRNDLNFRQKMLIFTKQLSSHILRIAQQSYFKHKLVILTRFNYCKINACVVKILKENRFCKYYYVR